MPKRINEPNKSDFIQLTLEEFSVFVNSSFHTFWCKKEDFRIDLELAGLFPLENSAHLWSLILRSTDSIILDSSKVFVELDADHGVFKITGDPNICGWIWCVSRCCLNPPGTIEEEAEQKRIDLIRAIRALGFQRFGIPDPGLISLPEGPDPAPTLPQTKISVWQERDRLHIHLQTLTDKTLHEWWDEDARQAIEDGFLDVSEAKLGSLERNVHQQGALHKSAYNYWKERTC